ncbi:hypothetical protein MHB81_04750 [Paenibacillus sp. FSL H7-0326]
MKWLRIHFNNPYRHGGQEHRHQGSNVRRWEIVAEMTESVVAKLIFFVDRAAAAAGCTHL